MSEPQPAPEPATPQTPSTEAPITEAGKTAVQAIRGEYVITNPERLIREVEKAAAMYEREAADRAAPADRIDAATVLDELLTNVEYLMEDHGTRVIDIEDLRAVVRGEIAAYDRLRGSR